MKTRKTRKRKEIGSRQPKTRPLRRDTSKDISTHQRLREAEHHILSAPTVTSRYVHPPNRSTYSHQIPHGLLFVTRLLLIRKIPKTLLCDSGILRFFRVVQFPQAIPQTVGCVTHKRVTPRCCRVMILLPTTITRREDNSHKYLRAMRL